MSTNILAIGGSSSRHSINKVWAAYVAQQLKDAEVRLLDLNDFEMPLYNIDRERSMGVPEQAHLFREAVAWADGIVLSLAEHNGSYTASFKNVIDWASRIDKAIWMNKPMFLTATSPGARGGRTVWEHAQIYLPRLGGMVVARFVLPQFRRLFNPERGILDAALASEFVAQLQKFDQQLKLQSLDSEV